MHKKKNSFIQKEDFFVIEMYPQSIISTAMSKKLNPNWRQTSFDGPVEKCSRIQQANPNDFIKNAVN